MLWPDPFNFETFEMPLILLEIYIMSFCLKNKTHTSTKKETDALAMSAGTPCPTAFAMPVQECRRLHLH